MRPPAQGHADLYTLMVRLADLHALQREYVLHDDPTFKQRSTIEAVAHEIAHGMYFGGIRSSILVGAAIRLLPDKAADAHELAALRIEAQALRQLGMRIYIEKFAAIARWRRKPANRASLFAPLSLLETDAVDLFISTVRSAASVSGFRCVHAR